MHAACTSACLTFHLTSGVCNSLTHSPIFFPADFFQSTFQTNLSNMAENTLEQLIEVVDASNALIGYVSGILPQKDDSVTIDDDMNDHDNDEHDHDTDSTISVGPEAPPEISSDIDMDTDNNTLSQAENSNNESDCCGPFLSESKLNINYCTNEPEAYFEALFDTSTWATLAQETNNYAWPSIRNKQGSLFHSNLIFICHRSKFMFML